MTHSTSKGSAHVVIIAAIVIVLAAALGFVFYKNFIAKEKVTVSNDSKVGNTASTSKKSTIEAVEGTDMMRYTNNSYGFRFDFPRQAYGSTGCEVQKQWYDNNGTLYDAPVSAYTSTNGMAEMTVHEGGNIFTIAQKQAPLLTQATYGNDQRQYYSACKMTPVTQSLIDGEQDLATPYRSWQIYTLGSQEDIAAKAKDLEGLSYNSDVTSIEYSLGTLQKSRQDVTYKFTYKTDGGFMGGSASKTWYYPAKKLLVHISLGQAQSFAKDATAETYYIDQIVDSFTVF